ncbi:MAG: helix-turn-helix transcriptional regulator [Ectothiorhodospiraceae bacterium]|nr:helix-turn-helix transcriptional regulator [Ectothiorhodospiraceae bacterium]
MTTEIGGRIAQIRGSRSQAAFAKDLGVHKNTLGGYERGERKPDAEFLSALMRAGYSANWVITGEGPMLLKDLQAAPGATSGMDLDLLERVGRTTFEELQARRLHLEPAAQARLVRVLYRHFATRQEQPDQETVSNIIDLAAYR